MANPRVLPPVLMVALGMSVARQNPPARSDGQRPVFRAGAHYAHVDAYPRGKDGRSLEGLTKDDFETFDTWTPDAARKDPRTQQNAYDLLADPTWRVFVTVTDP